jgi:hypothetical protein
MWPNWPLRNILYHTRGNTPSKALHEKQNVRKYNYNLYIISRFELNTGILNRI